MQSLKKLCLMKIKFTWKLDANDSERKAAQINAETTH